ncbi:hypothetical protein BCS37_00435 [Selenomonas sp. oral taxon 920]|uniref:aldo/keto reductase n=1 Tax=Selenomonas sp. oral taxon 920 TaxID=1884263 RepID=UPI000840CF30|nr:aldo/keto reductase [Selenomonas sp. oral taxon 920]AOH47007.1 hypothetical protein BCS37_00435 [Selenomonas sp. oral taxon 920]
MKHMVKLSSGASVPALGQGTWYLGDSAETHAREIEALRAGIEAGMTLIDTAENYGDGRSERLVGEAIRSYDRTKLFLVSKVMPSNAYGTRLMQSLDRSLSRLGTDYLDLYLYHWRGSHPLADMVAAMEKARASGKIRAWGVSNLDTTDMEELWRIPGGTNCAVNQVLYHMGSRGIDYSLLPWMREHNVALMAYCPLAQAGRLSCDLLGNSVLGEVAARHGATPAQIALAWAIRDGNTIAIPRTGRKEHAVSNAGADVLDLTAEDCAALDRAFPPPTRKEPLHIE